MGLVALAAAIVTTSANLTGGPNRGPAPEPSNLAHLAASVPPFPRCPTGATTTPVAQSLDGAFSACLRVGDVASGQYHVVVAAAITQEKLYPAQHEPRIRLSVSPRSGRPGSRVTLTGVVSVPHKLTTGPPPNKTSTAEICWGGCPGGLSDTLSTVRWSSTTTFRLHFRVPDAPWIEAGPSVKPRVMPLTSGIYRIGLRCLGPFAHSKCGFAPAEASVVFRLVVPKRADVARCPTPTSCAYLSLHPATSIPAQAVEVRGVTPIVSMIATRPNGAALAVLPGPASGTQIVFGPSPAPRVSLSYHWTHMGDASLDVKAPPSFASLGHFSVLSETEPGLSPVSSNPATPERVAHCAPGAAVITSFGTNGAVTTTSIPTAGAIAALAQSGFSRIYTPNYKPPSCAAVALPLGGQAVFVAFQVPVVPTETVQRDVGLQSFDDGASWSLLPVPSGATPTGFGGFRYQGDLVESVYSPAARDRAARPPLVEQFDPASKTWHRGSLGCPTSGPCVTFGPFSWSNCAGGIHADQELMRSSDRGASWSEPLWPALVDPCAGGELAAISTSTELLVHGSMRFPYLILRSTDGGATWSDVGLPSAPFVAATGLVTGQITLLSNGALLLLTNRPGTWELLPSGSQRWCTVRSIPDSTRSSARSGSGFSVFGGQLWWIRANGATSSTLDHIEIADVMC